MGLFDQASRCSRSMGKRTSTIFTQRLIAGAELLPALFAPRSSIRSASLQAFESCVLFSHAVADAAFAGLNRAAQCFHIIPARLVEWAWFGHAETWNKNKNGNSCDGPSAHDVTSVTAHTIVLEI